MLSFSVWLIPNFYNITGIFEMLFSNTWLGTNEVLELQITIVLVWMNRVNILINIFICFLKSNLNFKSLTNHLTNNDLIHFNKHQTIFGPYVYKTNLMTEGIYSKLKLLFINCLSDFVLKIATHNRKTGGTSYCDF